MKHQITCKASFIAICCDSLTLHPSSQASSPLVSDLNFHITFENIRHKVVSLDQTGYVSKNGYEWNLNKFRYQPETHTLELRLQQPLNAGCH